MRFLNIINEVHRHFKTGNERDVDILFLTSIGIDVLWHDIHGFNPHCIAVFTTLQDADSGVDFIIRLDPILPYGFRLSSSDNACVSDADHEALKSAKRRFANHKLLHPKKVTAGLHSTPRCC